MALTPAYGETPVPEDDLEALVPRARQALEEPIIKAAIYDLEQAIQEDVTEALLTDAPLSPCSRLATDPHWGFDEADVELFGGLGD